MAVRGAGAAIPVFAIAELEHSQRRHAVDRKQLAASHLFFISVAPQFKRGTFALTHTIRPSRLRPESRTLPPSINLDASRAEIEQIWTAPETLNRIRDYVARTLRK
jgi:hypothetical protein